MKNDAVVDKPGSYQSDDATIKTRTRGRSLYIERFCQKWDKVLNYVLHNERFLVQKRYFTHFYITALLNLATLLIVNYSQSQYDETCLFWWFRYDGADNGGIITYLRLIMRHIVPMLRLYTLDHLIAVVLLILHLCRRLYECMYVHSWNKQSKMHIAGYFLGILHYFLLPMVFLYPRPIQIDDSLTVKSNIAFIRLLSSIILCIAGQFEQYKHHFILANMRKCDFDKNIRDSYGNNKKRTKSPACISTFDHERRHGEYSIPTSRLFDFVTCPHYLAEIIIYFSFAILLRSAKIHEGIKYDAYSSPTSIQKLSKLVNIPSHLGFLSSFKHLGVFIWVLTNLSISSMQSHSWYLKRFGESYPKKRKRLFPFCW